MLNTAKPHQVPTLAQGLDLKSSQGRNTLVNGISDLQCPNIPIFCFYFFLSCQKVPDCDKMRGINASFRVLVIPASFPGERICPVTPTWEPGKAPWLKAKPQGCDGTPRSRQQQEAQTQGGKRFLLAAGPPFSKPGFCSLSRLVGFFPSCELVSPSYSSLLINHNLQLTDR